MAETRVTLADLGARLRQHTAYLFDRNLVLVALPLESAHRDARQLAAGMGAEYLDFDKEFLDQLAADGWEDHVKMERRGTLSVGQDVAWQWLTQKVVRRINDARPLVIGNVNLAVRYGIDLGKALYDATERGLCVIAAGGRVQGNTLLVHGTMPQTGAGSSVYEVVPPAEESDPEPPHVIQERLL